MAGTNKFIKYATTAGGDGFDTYSDTELYELAVKDGIPFGAVARTNILNGLMRQLTYTNSLFNDVIASKMSSTSELNTSMIASAYKDNVISAIENIAKGVTVTLAGTISYTGTRSGITVNSQGLVTNLVALVESDIPSLSPSKITQDTNNRFVTDAQITSWNGRVVANTTITGGTKTKITYDAKGLVTGGGDLILSDLPSIAQNTFLGRTDPGTGVVSALGRDSLLGLTSNGFVKRTGFNTYAIDTATYAEASNVALRDANSPIVPKFWVGTETQYNAIETKDSAVVYIIL